MSAVLEATATRRFLVGTAVPYDRGTRLYDDASKGVIEERFDDRSWRSLDPGGEVIPLLVHHDASRPIGRITRVRHEPEGLRVEARLGRVP